MTPKEKAKKLINIFYDCRVIDYEAAKQCAKVAVDEMIRDGGTGYWYEVKQEIEKL